MLISTIKYTFLIPKTRNRICREHLFFSTTLISIDFSVTIYETQIVKKRVNSHWCHTLLVKRDANEKKKSLKINNLRLDQQSCFLFYLFLTKKVNLCEWRNDFSQSVGWVFLLSFWFFVLRCCLTLKHCPEGNLLHDETEAKKQTKPIKQKPPHSL